jgi:hypothetical protein
MGRKLTGSTPRDIIPPRVYGARVACVYELGTQPPSTAQYDAKLQYLVTFELHSVRRNVPALDPQGEVYQVSGFVPAYLGSSSKPSHMLDLIQACEGRKFTQAEIDGGYDPETLIGALLQVKVTTATKVAGGEYSKAESYLAIDPDDVFDESTGKGFDPEPIVSDVFFEIDPKNPTVIPADVPEWVGKMIMKSSEYQAGLKRKPEPEAAPAGDAGAAGNRRRRTAGAAAPAPAASTATATADDEDIPF